MGEDLSPMSGPARIRAAVLAALPSWLVARGLVLGALVLARHLFDHLDPLRPNSRVTLDDGLLGWDAAYYADIAEGGYGRLPEEALRFFPLVAMLGKAVGLLGIGPRWGVVVVANASALAAGALLFLLARHEGRDLGLATRATWFLALAPAAFTLVMGYTEATLLALVIGMFLALRSQHWWVAAGLGLLAGLGRPSGFLVAVPALVEAVRHLGAAGGRERVARAAAVVSGPVGALLYLTWVGLRFDDPWLPYSVQTRTGLKGSFTNPFETVADALDGLVGGDAVGTGLHVPWMFVAIGLVVVCWRTWPTSYAAFATVTVGSAIVSSNLDSFERYALGAFPLVLVVASLTASRRVERVVLVTSACAMTAYALLAFSGAYVP